jgi:indoleamine 2,3-dioxygenase
MLLLSYFGHAYVWGETEPATALPASIAVPWHAVAKALGRPPVLSYASYALDNWRRLDPDRLVALGNIVPLQNFLGGVDEEWFVLVHVDIEQRAATALCALFHAAQARDTSDEPWLIEALTDVADSLAGMYATLARMSERCEPYIYFHRVRPYIHGWKDNPALPDGLVYDGVDEYRGQPQRFRGETGAQSSIVPSLDAALGVTHADDPLRTYLNEMRDYMPPGHRRFIAHLEATSRVRELVESGGRDLRDVYNRCVQTLAEFRSLHRNYAEAYIARQHERASESPNPHDVGTGGTPFMEYLGKHRDETVAHVLGPAENP